MSDVESLKNHIKGLTAQCEASKQMLNETLASCMQLRTNMHVLSGQLQEAYTEMSELKRIKAENEKQIVELGQRITELTPKTECAATQDDCIAG